MAEVQLALQRGPAGFEKLVVVKLVHANLATQKTFVDMLLDEARVAALVKHPNVVDIYDLGEADGRYFIAMEYLEGEPLLAVLRAGREGKRLDPLSTARLIADTAEGLDAAHELRIAWPAIRIELVHHDVSLGNIVVLYNGQVKLVDFGVAKASRVAAAAAEGAGQVQLHGAREAQGRGRRSPQRYLVARLRAVGGAHAAPAVQGRQRRRHDEAGARAAIPPPSTVNGDVLADFDPIVMSALERDPDEALRDREGDGAGPRGGPAQQATARKNDRIAKYMQATFKSHINARKKLAPGGLEQGPRERRGARGRVRGAARSWPPGDPRGAHARQAAARSRPLPHAAPGPRRCGAWRNGEQRSGRLGRAAVEATTPTSPSKRAARAAGPCAGRRCARDAAAMRSPSRDEAASRSPAVRRRRAVVIIVIAVARWRRHRSPAARERDPSATTGRGRAARADVAMRDRAAAVDAAGDRRRSMMTRPAAASRTPPPVGHATARASASRCDVDELYGGRTGARGRGPRAAIAGFRRRRAATRLRARVARPRSVRPEGEKGQAIAAFSAT